MKTNFRKSIQGSLADTPGITFEHSWTDAIGLDHWQVVRFTMGRINEAANRRDEIELSIDDQRFDKGRCNLSRLSYAHLDAEQAKALRDKLIEHYPIDERATLKP